MSHVKFYYLYIYIYIVKYKILDYVQKKVINTSESPKIKIFSKWVKSQKKVAKPLV